MDRFFSMFGKLILGAMLLVFVLGTGYYIGTKKNKIEHISSTPAPTSQLQVDTAKTQPTVFIKETPLPTKENMQKTINGGLSGSASFSEYSVQIPEGWRDKRETTPDVSDKVTLTKENYSVIIYQAAFGGGGCTYKGDPPTAMAQSFGNFVDIKGNAAQFRRSWNSDTNTHISYTICQRGKDNLYSSITNFGRIDAVSPDPADETILSELDSIIASLKKQ